MRVTETEIEILLGDLQEDAQKEFLKAMGIKTSDEGNYEVFPIAIVSIPEPSMKRLTKLTGERKVLQREYIREMDKNLKERPDEWQEKNSELSVKIENLFMR